MTTPNRVLSVVAIPAVIPLQAGAQIGGMPGSSDARGFDAAPLGPPPACKQLFELRDETLKSARAIESAGGRKAAPVEACELYKTYIAVETKVIKAIDEVGPQCGVPADVPEQLKARHAKTQRTAKQVCDSAARGGRPKGPNWDAPIGISPTMADAQGERFRVRMTSNPGGRTP
jgi:hypothetical protein